MKLYQRRCIFSQFNISFGSHLILYSELINCKLILIFYLIILYHKIHRVCHIFNKIQFCYTYKTNKILFICFRFNKVWVSWKNSTLSLNILLFHLYWTNRSTNYQIKPHTKNMHVHIYKFYTIVKTLYNENFLKFNNNGIYSL